MGENMVHTLATGTKLCGRYVIRKVIGQGGYGITYKGYDETLDLDIAIKEFYPQGLVTRNSSVSNMLTINQSKYSEGFDAGKERFLKEARILAKFNKQPGIVHVTDFFDENNTAYIVMEYLDGITLKQYIAQYGLFQVNDLLQLMAPLIEALDAVHAAGLIHRDISPDNIMLLSDGNLKLMDFGAARDYTEFGQKSLSIVLKHGYAPEEQYRTRGMQGPWTDIYALSATIYKCITGVTPEESLQRMMEDHIAWPSQLGVNIDPVTEQALMRGLSVFQKDRYQNMREFTDAVYLGNVWPEGDGSASPGSSGYGAGGYGAGNRAWNGGNPTAGVGGYAGNGDWSTGGPGNVSNGGNSGGRYQGYEMGGRAKKGSSNTKAAIIGILAGLAVVLVIGIVVVGGALKNSTTEKASVTTEATTEEATTASASVTVATTEATVATTEAATTTTAMDYCDNSSPDVFSCLSTSEYQEVFDDTANFSFAYPKHMFDYGEKNTEGQNVTYTFDNTSNSQVSMIVTAMVNSGDTESREKALYNRYEQHGKGFSDENTKRFSSRKLGDKDGYYGLVNSWANDSHDTMHYVIVAAINDYDYVLDIYLPDRDYTNYKLEEDYIVECVYRFCSFSGSSKKPRSYEKFQNDED